MALVRVQNRVKLAEPSLPSEVTAMGLNIEERSPDILKIISFNSPDGSLDYKFISNYVKINVQSALARVDGISSADILGEAEYSMRLWLDPNRMANLGLSVVIVMSSPSTVATSPAVTHCYQRPTYDDWHYSHFTMVHATTKKECEQIADEPNHPFVRRKVHLMVLLPLAARY